jgi:hypothetical protein
MYAGWIVGTGVAVLLLLAGIVGQIVSRQRRVKNKWAWWCILIGCMAIVSAFINAQFA